MMLWLRLNVIDLSTAPEDALADSKQQDESQKRFHAIGVPDD